MNKLITASCIAGGLMGIGIIAYLLLREEDVEQPLDDLLKTKVKSKPAKNHASQAKAMKTVSASVENKVAATTPLTEKVSVPPIVPVLEDSKAEVVMNAVPPPEQDEFPLRLGSVGHRVERLKIFLMRNYGVFGKINQRFDEKTAALLLKYLGSDTLDLATYNKYKMGNHVTEQLIIR